MPGKKQKNTAVKETVEAAEKVSLFDVPEKAVLREGPFFQKNVFVLFSFLIPFALMFIAFAVMGCRPFGDKQILVTDLWHQYYPFLVDLADKLKHGESLFWSWTQGSGTNYFALASYYLASPLNIFTIFIPKEGLDIFLTFSVVLKIGLAGGFFALFLRYTFKRDDISLVIFSTCFALSAFFMGYYWCEIWLDTVALTPLVVMGFVALMREGRYRLYVITLALSILANYYIGLFTCIFMMLVFIGYNVCKWDGIKEFGRRFARVAICSVLGIMLTLFFMLPAYFGLQNTHAAGSVFPTGYQINIGSSNDFLGTMDAIRQVISNTGAFVAPSTTEGLPNIACGVISIVLGIMFMVSRKIKLREKIFTGCLLLFLIMSFIIRQLDYIWHGFHFTNMVPYRFSYLVSFVLVVMAFRAFTVIDSINHFDLIITALVTVIIVLLGIGKQEILVLISTPIIALLILAALFLFKKDIIKKSILAIILAAIVVVQGAGTAYLGVKTTSVTTTYDYPRGGQNTADVVKHMKDVEKNTPELWRAEFTSTQTLCDSALNGFNGVSMFSSMTNESYTRFAENFGLMGWLSGNRYTYAESTPVTELFLNLKYIIARDGNYNDAEYLKEVFNSGTVKLLENKNYIPMGMMVNENLLNYKGEDNEDEYNVFDKQNEFFKLATGIKENLYTKLDVVNQGHTDYKTFPVNRLDYGSYSFSTNDSKTKPHVKWNYLAPKSGYYYAYTQISNADNVTIYKNGTARPGTSVFYIRRPYAMSIGYYKKGDTISVYSDLEEGANGSAKVYVNLFNDKAFNKGLKAIKDNYMQTTSLTGSSMAGKIYAPKDGLFYTSIPYEPGQTDDDSLMGKLFATRGEGWTAKVDGKDKEITPIAHALTAFKLSKGNHEISLSYLPKGFTRGTIISIIGLLLFAGYTVFRKARKKEIALLVNAEEKTEE